MIEYLRRQRVTIDELPLGAARSTGKCCLKYGTEYPHLHFVYLANGHIFQNSYKWWIL